MRWIDGDYIAGLGWCWLFYTHCLSINHNAKNGKLVPETSSIKSQCGAIELDGSENRTGARTWDATSDLQLSRLNSLLAAVSRRPFYQQLYSEVIPHLSSLDQLIELPILEKSDLITAGLCAPGKQFDLPRGAYTRFHQTSGTKGFPMVVLDTADDWQWWLHCWDHVLDAAAVTSADVAMMAFSFGPFIGFWTANDALVKRGALVVPGGGLSSENRLRLIEEQGCTVLCCTPTYALHLISVAEEAGVSLSESSITRVIVAGEPGGSIESVRRRIEVGWGARVIDHCGASEVGAWGFGDREGKGIHVIETEFIAEVLKIDQDNPRGIPVADGTSGELVLTSLGRLGGPVIRYRTGDVVQAYRTHALDCPFLWLKGGVIGRSDDMLVIRGVNVFPSSIEAIIRETLAYAEFRMIATRVDEMDQLRIEVEGEEEAVNKLAQRFRDRLSLRIDVKGVPNGTLPRFEAKARRLVDQR